MTPPWGPPSSGTLSIPPAFSCPHTFCHMMAQIRADITSAPRSFPPQRKLAGRKSAPEIGENCDIPPTKMAKITEKYKFCICEVPLEQKSLHTQLLLLGINIAITHISYTALIVEELICVMRVYLWCLLVLPL